MLILLFVDIIYLLNKHFHFLPFNLKQIEVKRMIMLSAFALIALIMIWGRYNFYNKKIETLNININKKAKTESLKIVAASDLHLGYSIDKKQLKKIVDLINSQKPDIIMLVGDIADTYSEPVIEQNMKEEFLQLNAPLGVYGVIGNHECYGDTQKTVDYLKSSGIVMLQDSSVLLDNDIYLVGRNDKSIRNRKTLSELVENIDKQKPVILLDHQPFNLEQAQQNGIDLQISGHTHGGQIFPFTLITNAIYERQHGYLKKENTHYFISSGVGGWGPKLRLGSQTEIVVITLNLLPE
jgi:predicted MPP superfamily phosphohydrolase